MVKLEIIELKKSTKLFKWSAIIGLAFTLLGIISNFPKKLYISTLVITVISLAFLKFMNKAVKIGSLIVKDNEVKIEIDGKITTSEFNSIKKLRITNYYGQQYFAIRDLYPFNDGLNNYIWINGNSESVKIEFKIKSKQSYKELQKLFFSSRKPFKNLDWKIKSL